MLRKLICIFVTSLVISISFGQESKEDLRNPPQITIRGDLDAIKQLLIREMLSEGESSIINENASQIVFKRIPSKQSYLTQVLVGGKQYNLVTITLTSLNGEVQVLLDTDIAVTNPDGVERRISTGNNNKKYRAQIKQMLADLKTKVEAMPAASQTNRIATPGSVVSSGVNSNNLPTQITNTPLTFELPAESSAQGFSYKGNKLIYQGRNLYQLKAAQPGYLQRQYPKFKISLLKNRGLAAAIALDEDGQNLALLLDLNNFTATPVGQDWVTPEIYWSPAGNYLLFLRSYEGERFIGIDLNTKRVRTGNFMGTKGKAWHIDNEPRWASENSLAFRVKESCNPYDDSATNCNQSNFNKVLAVRDVWLDAATLMTSLTAPPVNQNSSQRPLNNNPVAPQANRSAAIVFSSKRDGDQEIYLLDLTTGKQTNLSQHPASEDGYPRFSPDGQKIAFATNRNGRWQIFLMNRDGSAQRLLTDGGYADWSPDGQALVFALNRKGYNEIYSINANGSGLKQLTSQGKETVHPAYSPDGKKIAFASEKTGNRQLYVMNADGSNLARLTNSTGYDDYPAWSPDGKQLAFASDRDSRRSDKLELYVMNADGTSVRRRTNQPGDDRHPTRSTDGKRIAFVSDRNGSRDIFAMAADGTGTVEKLVATLGDDEHPNWLNNPQGAQAQNEPPKPTAVKSQGTIEGTVIEYNEGMHNFGLVVEADGKRYDFCTQCRWGDDPIIIGGNVTTAGTWVRVEYKNLARTKDKNVYVFDALRVTKLSPSSITKNQPQGTIKESQQPVRIAVTRELFEQMVREKQIEHGCLKEVSGKLEELFYLNTIDLNRDGKPELELTGKGCTCDGGKRCAIWIYEKTVTGYRRIFSPYGAIEEIVPENTYTNGYRDLGFIVWAGDMPVPYQAKFDGQRYQVSEYKINDNQRRVTPPPQRKETSLNQPPIPKEYPGACPFEGCNFGRWRVNKPLAFYADRNDSSPIVFRANKGERVKAITGVQVITSAGRLTVIKPVVENGVRLNRGESFDFIRAGEEGGYELWYKGKGLWVEGTVYFQVIKNLEYVWWVKVKNAKGQIGWTKQSSSEHLCIPTDSNGLRC